MLCDTRKGVVYGTRLSESGFAIANPYQSQVLRLLFGTSKKGNAKKRQKDSKESLKVFFGSFFYRKKNRDFLILCGFLCGFLYSGTIARQKPRR
jgi:hypothetical protein